MKIPGRRWVAGPGLALLAACNDPPTGVRPGQLVIVAAPVSAGAPGWALTDTLKVRLVDLSGNPLPARTVTWVVITGGGSIAPVSTTTDAEGISAALWTLGASAGPNSVRVRSDDDTTVTFQATGEAFRVDRLDAAASMGCGLVSGALWCWGDGFWGGTPPASHRDLFGWIDSSPGLVDATHDFVDLAVRDGSVCGLDQQGAVWCVTRDSQAIALVGGLPPLRSIVGGALSDRHCGLAVSDSTAWCWQTNQAAAAVPASLAFTDLWMGGNFGVGLGFTACGLRTDSTAACWGEGPLGDGSAIASDAPVAVSGVHRFVELAVGQQFACGRTTAGAVWCWGKDYEDFAQNAPDILVPTLATTGANRIAATLIYLQAMTGTGMVRWQGAGFEGLSLPTGLEQLPVVRFAVNANSCVQLVDDQVYCYDEMWDRSSVLREDSYAPVQPVRAASPAPARH